jgi:predicted DNA-binding WGR domain protein
MFRGGRVMTFLRKINPAENLNRFYLIDTRRDLFGNACVLREWGRAGQAGTVRVDHYPTDADAGAALLRLHQSKTSRGYRTVR